MGKGCTENLFLTFSCSCRNSHALWARHFESESVFLTSVSYYHSVLYMTLWKAKLLLKGQKLKSEKPWSCYLLVFWACRMTYSMNLSFLMRKNVIVAMLCGSFFLYNFSHIHRNIYVRITDLENFISKFFL